MQDNTPVTVADLIFFVAILLSLSFSVFSLCIYIHDSKCACTCEHTCEITD